MSHGTPWMENPPDGEPPWDGEPPEDGEPPQDGDPNPPHGESPRWRTPSMENPPDGQPPRWRTPQMENPPGMDHYWIMYISIEFHSFKLKSVTHIIQTMTVQLLQ